MDNKIMCGGDYWKDGETHCVRWSPDTGTWGWETLLTLNVWRWGHVSWPLDFGIYLMGGRFYGYTTTMVSWNGTQSPGFFLKYDT